jgi:hypothetical protein
VSEHLLVVELWMRVDLPTGVDQAVGQSVDLGADASLQIVHTLLFVAHAHSFGAAVDHEATARLSTRRRATSN